MTIGDNVVVFGVANDLQVTRLATQDAQVLLSFFFEMEIGEGNFDIVKNNFLLFLDILKFSYFHSLPLLLNGINFLQFVDHFLFPCPQGQLLLNHLVCGFESIRKSDLIVIFEDDQGVHEILECLLFGFHKEQSGKMDQICQHVVFLSFQRLVLFA